MGGSSIPQWLTAVATMLLFAGAFAAAFFARKQVLATKKHVLEIHTQTMVDRTLAMHRDFRTGELQEAQRRLGAMLWFISGSDPENRLVCYQPMFKEFLPEGRVTASGTQPAGALSKYPNWIINAAKHRPLDDMYLILGAFERLYGAQKNGSLDEALFWERFAYPIRWWFGVFIRIEDIGDTGRGNTPNIAALHKLALDTRIKGALSEGEAARLGMNFELDANSRNIFMGFDNVSNPSRAFGIDRSSRS